MKFRLLFVTFLCLCNLIHAQSMMGIWRGYFYSGYGSFKQQYKYEVQLNQLSNKAAQKAVQGVTYSYRTTVFYGKASLQGIYDSKNKSITIKETKLVELKIADRSEPCLMTCYLDYSKDGKTEVLEGTFTSINVNTKGDCGAGYVYLEKVEESDFKKEDFLVKKTKPSTKPSTVTKEPVTKATPNTQQNNSSTKQPPVVKKTNPSAKTTPKTNNNKPPDNTPKKQVPYSDKDTIVKLAPAIPPVNTPSQDAIIKKKVPVPDILKERDNTLLKKIITSSSDIQIQLFDNGEIDGDTITVYDNNEVIAYRKGLTKKAITLNIKATPENPVHEIVMVANNLGSIPPNTALMIVMSGGKNYELFVSSDEKKNAKVIIEFKVVGTESK